MRNMGGIMGLENQRQGYFLGKLVKKAKRAVKKIVRSPVGKLGLLAAGGLGLSKAGLLSKLVSGGKLTGLGQLALGAGISAAPLLFQEEEEEQMEREFRPAQKLEVREAQSGEVRVSGYAAVFGEETNIGGMFTEEISRGAFKDAIGRDDVVFLINHEGLPLARTRSGTLTLEEDERGLYMEASLDASDPDVRSIVPKMKRGDLDKMSFAFVPTRQSWDDSKEMPKRMIEEAQLYDVSIVTTPAYNGTEIGLRSLENHRKQSKKSQAARRLRMKAQLKR